MIAAAEAARILGVDRSTLTRQAASGKVPTSGKLPGKRGAYLFNRLAVEAVPGRASGARCPGPGDQLVVHVNSRGIIEISETALDQLLLHLGHAETSTIESNAAPSPLPGN